jgi:hypothetical protein
MRHNQKRKHLLSFRLFEISFLLLTFCLNITAQTDSLSLSTIETSIDTTLIDSLVNGVKKDNPLRKFFKKPDGLPQPRTSLILSLVVPGAGQVYNGKWWKVPLVYGAIGGLGYLINDNTNKYIQLRTAYKRKQAGLIHNFTDTRFDSSTALKSERDKYDKNRQLSYVGIVIVWLINGIEAFTDAHLMNFDVSDDLSLEFRPVFEETLSQETYSGVGLVLRFGR